MKRRVAVINMTRMGDLLMTGPLIDAVRLRHPDAGIDLVVVEGFKAIGHGLDVDRVLPVDFNGMTTVAVNAARSANIESLAGAIGHIRESIRDLIGTRYEAIYNASHTNVSMILAHLMDGPVVAGLHLDSEGYRRIGGRWARYFFAGNLNRGINPFHMVDVHRGFADGHTAGIEARMKYEPDSQMRERAHALLVPLRTAGRPLVAFQCGASAEDKRWDADSFGRVAKMLGRARDVNAVFVGTAEESELAQRAIRASGASALDLTGRTNLEELAWVLDEADLLVTNDTGTMHLAQAMGTPSLVVTLGSALSDETGPYGEGNVIVEPRIGCFPCSFHTLCPHYECHAKVTPEAVARIAGDMLEGALPQRYTKDEIGEGCVVWRTGFDPDGWWIKQPLLPPEIRLNDAVRELYRELLKVDLEPEAGTRQEAERKVAARWLALFGADVALLRERIDRELLAGDRLLERAEEARDQAERLLQLAEESSEAVDDMVRSSEAMTVAQEAILDEGSHRELWAPLAMLLRFDLENLPTEGLIEQARATVQAQRRVLRLIRGIHELVKGAFAEVAALEYDAEEAPAAQVDPNGNGATRRQQMQHSPGGMSSLPEAAFERLRRPRMRGERLTVIMPYCSYFVQDEVLRTLHGMGHRVITIEFRENARFIEQMLTASLEADLLFTINHLGFDKNGELSDLLERIELPYVSWYVDRPGFILLDNRITPSDRAFVYSWESATLDEIREYGFEHVKLLPLATEPERFHGPIRPVEGSPLRWVAHSMVKPVDEWQAKANVSEYPDELFRAAVQQQRSGRPDPREAVEQAARITGFDTQRWTKGDRLHYASAVALTATRDARRELAETCAPLGLEVHGDRDWPEWAPDVPYVGGFPYQSDTLPRVYARSVQLNLTNYQMPTAVNQRVFDIPLAGGWLVTDAQAAMDELFDTKSECTLFDSIEEGADRAHYALQHPEQMERTRARAAERIIQEHTYTHRLKTILADVRRHVGRVAMAVEGGTP